MSDLNCEFTLWEFHRAFPILNLARKSSPELGSSFLLGPTSTGAGTIAFDPTFGSFTLLELVSQ